MNELQIFNNPKFGQVRTLKVDGIILFGATDIARALGYVNPNDAIIRHCRGVVKHEGIENSGFGARRVQINFIPEGDIYRLAAKSELPGAEQFESWIFDDVLPSIRKHGAYITPDTLEQMVASPEFGIRLLTEIKEEREKRQQAEEIIEKQKPQVLFAEAVTGSSTSILVADLAKILKKNGIEIGEIRLWEWLRNNGYAIREKGRSFNMPTQKSMELKVMEIKEGTYINSKGNSKITKTTLITGKGQIYFVNKFLKEKVLCQI